MFNKLLILLLLIPLCHADSSITSLERTSTATGLSVLEVTLDTNNTGYLSFTTPALFGKLYAVDWYSASTLADDNTIYINASAPYARSLASYNMTIDASNTTYPHNGVNLTAFRSPLTFYKANGTSDMVATVFLYLER